MALPNWDVSRFAYKSIRLHRGRFAYTTKSFRLHALSRFAYIKVVSPTHKSNCFWKMDEYHCLQLAKHSYLTVFSVKFRDISAFAEEENDFWFEFISEGSRNWDFRV